jgi:hypothetical protein
MVRWQMDLIDACEQVRTVLNAPEFLRGLWNIIEKERRLRHVRELRSGGNWNLRNLSRIELLEDDKQIIESDRALYRYFQDFAIAKLPKPAIISADDLQYVAFTTLGGMSAQTADSQFQNFIDHVVMRLEEDERGDQFNLGSWALVGYETEADYDREISSAESNGLAPLPNGYQLLADFEESNKRNLVRTVKVSGQFTGTCSELAIQRLTENIRPLIESLVLSMQLSVTEIEMAPAKEPWKAIMEMIEDIDLDRI